MIAAMVVTTEIFLLPDDPVDKIDKPAFTQLVRCSRFANN